MSARPGPYYDCAMIHDLASFFFHQGRIAEEESNRVYEAVIGVVTDIKDDQKLCRVKVKLPNMPITDNTWWCTWVSIGGGTDRGWFSLPEVDDEVLVMFEHGDIARPVIVGALWNGKDKPPHNNADGSNNVRLFKSKSGHIVKLDDDTGTIEMHDGGGVGVVTISKENKVEFEAKDGDACYQAKEEMLILAKEISIESSGPTTFLSGSQGSKYAGANITFESSSTLKIDASKTELNCGGASEADKAAGEVAEVPDPIKG